MTKLLGVIGDPIAHSLSPLIHNGWLRDMHIDATYEAMHVAQGDFPAALKALAERDVLGVNVTLPHKGAALTAASQASEAAVTIGAANTLTYLGADQWRADNTDAPGFIAMLGDIDPASTRALILGAGGSARAIVFALIEAGIPVTILNRTEAKAEAIAVELGNANTVYGSFNQLNDYIDNVTTVINTTSIGYSGDVIALPEGAGRSFIDISYGKISEPQLSFAKQKGWTTMGGLHMLVAQAAISFELWFGERPSIEAGLRRCQSAVKATS